MPALRDEDIRGLDVPVDDASRVRGVERVGDLDGQFEQQPRLERFARNAVPERLPLQELHGDERLAFVFADFVDRANVRMVERRGGPGLALKPLERLPVPGEVFGKELQRHHAAEFGVLGFVHDTHPPASELFEDAVVGNCFAEHAWGAYPVSGMLGATSREVNVVTRCDRVFTWLKCRPPKTPASHKGTGVESMISFRRASAWSDFLRVEM